MNSVAFRFPLLLALVVGLAACATTSPSDELAGGFFGPAMGPAKMNEAITAARSHPFGSEKNPVRASMPDGERGYLARLRCSDGVAPSFQRGGSVGRGPYGNILDVYGVQCKAGTPASTAVYMDMYHDHVEDAPVVGFTIVAP